MVTEKIVLAHIKEAKVAAIAAADKARRALQLAPPGSEVAAECEVASKSATEAVKHLEEAIALFWCIHVRTEESGAPNMDDYYRACGLPEYQNKPR
jgi:hypothetical protein